MGYQEAKQLAEPFVKSLMTNYTNNLATEAKVPAQLSSASSTNKAIRLYKGYPLKRLVRMFSNISIQEGKGEIASRKVSKYT
jgi:hypothetical protein